MSILLILSLIGVGVAAGLIGALVGLGGGIIITPALVLIFGFDFKVAVAASLVAVVATSTAAGSVYVGKGLANMRLGMMLEIATTLGGISGGLLALLIPSKVLSGIFAAMIVLTATLMMRGQDPHNTDRKSEDDPAALSGQKALLTGHYYDPFFKKDIHYQVRRLPFGSAISFVAGVLSGMLGVGGGFIKVPAMNLGMGVPIKVAAATSNFMIGVTAVSSLFVYFSGDFVHPLIVAPVAIGVVVGALAGTRISHSVSPKALKLILGVVLIVVAIEMLLRSLGVGLAH